MRGRDPIATSTQAQTRLGQKVERPPDGRGADSRTHQDGGASASLVDGKQDFFARLTALLSSLKIFKPQPGTHFANAQPEGFQGRSGPSMAGLQSSSDLLPPTCRNFDDQGKGHPSMES